MSVRPSKNEGRRVVIQQKNKSKDLVRGQYSSIVIRILVLSIVCIRIAVMHKVCGITVIEVNFVI